MLQPGRLMSLRSGAHDIHQSQVGEDVERSCSTSLANLSRSAVAEFVKSRTYWVPSAIVTIILALEYCGFAREAITKAFSPLAGQLRFDP